MWKRREHSIDALFLVLTFFIFVFSAVIALALATQFYHGIVSRSTHNENSRVAIAYMREAVHQTNAAAKVTVDTFEGNPCIRLEQEEGYERLLYFCDGQLMELYAKKDGVIQAKDGQKIIALKNMTIERMTQNSVEIICTDQDGAKEMVHIATNSGR